MLGERGLCLSQGVHCTDNTIFPTTTCTVWCCHLMHESPRQKRQSSGTGIFGMFFLLPLKGARWMGLGDCCWPGVRHKQGYRPAGAASSFKGTIPSKSCFPGPKASWGSACRCLEHIQFGLSPCLKALPPPPCQNPAKELAL